MRTPWHRADVSRPNWKMLREETDAEEARRLAEEEEEEEVLAWLLGMPEAQEDHDPIDEYDLE